MYITAETVEELKKKFGAPEEIALSYEMARTEFDMVRRSQKHGRAHDVTLFIIDQGRVVVIKKPMYPEGAYRAPSGGIEPGEPFEEGALREAYEETGLAIALARYLFRVKVRFTCAGDSIDWTSYVFSARPAGGHLQPIDTHEIVEARFASVEELQGPIKSALLASGSTGLRYRSDLNDMVLGKLVGDGLLTIS
ncbi:MAG TPA: NUDIX hydrolase [Blastocatellia bacterium]|nr:NUDIX hydrolase [Blastocatellia bacterium]